MIAVKRRKGAMQQTAKKGEKKTPIHTHTRSKEKREINRNLFTPLKLVQNGGEKNGSPKPDADSTSRSLIVNLLARAKMK